MSTSCCANISAAAAALGPDSRQWGKLQGRVRDIAEPLTLTDRNSSQQEVDGEKEARRRKSDPDGSWKEPALLRPFCQGTNFTRVTQESSSLKQYKYY